MIEGEGAFLAGVAAFGGAIVGGIATVAAQFLQAAATRRQQLVSSAAQLATVAYEREMALYKKPKDTLQVPPLALYVAFYVAVLRALEAGTPTKKDIERLEKQYGVHFCDPPTEAQQGAPVRRPRLRRGRA